MTIKFVAVEYSCVHCGEGMLLPLELDESTATFPDHQPATLACPWGCGTRTARTFKRQKGFTVLTRGS